MILGNHMPSQAFKRNVLSVADGNFDRPLACTENDLPPIPEGWTIHLETLIAIKMRGNCDPHVDELQVPAPKVPHGKRVEQCSLFWLVHDTSKITDTSRSMTQLFAEGKFKQMKPNDWAMFDDTELHGFFCNGTWAGIAVQMTSIT